MYTLVVFNNFRAFWKDITSLTSVEKPVVLLILLDSQFFPGDSAQGWWELEFSNLWKATNHRFLLFTFTFHFIGLLIFLSFGVSITFVWEAGGTVG